MDYDIEIKARLATEKLFKRLFMIKSNPPDPKDMFGASRSLIMGAKIVMDSEGIRDRGLTKMPALPAIVCCALAIEIGIKAFLTLEGKPFPREGKGHSLKALFDSLPTSMQQDLLSFQVQFTGINPSDAKAKLEDEDMTFVNWRYAYEHASLSTSPAFLHDFGVAVSEMLRSRLEMAPDKKDSRSIAEQQQAMQARQAAQEQEHPDEATLVQQYGLQPTGARVTAEIPGLEPVTGTVQGIEADPESGGYALRLLADDGEVYIVTGEDGGVVRPAAVGAGTREAPLQAADGRDVDAAVQENTNPGSSLPKNTAQESNARQTWGAKEGLVSRYFLQVILIAMLGSCTYFSWQSIFDRDGPESLSTRQAVDAQKAAEARRQVLKNSVVEMAAKVNAVTNWASNLADGRDRQSSILTAELQKQWVISRPILLLGNIQDIALNSDATYQVVVAHDPFSTTNTLFFPDIRMSLRCPESVAAPLIQAAKKESASPMGAITAVTAVIESIVTTRETDAKGEADTVMTGIGKCLDAMYLTERISWP